MKFSCDKCQAKYQVPDDKVAGKTLRMSCRKCGHPIEVRAPMVVPGAETPASAEPQAARNAPAPEPAAQANLNLQAATPPAAKTPSNPPAQPQSAEINPAIISSRSASQTGQFRSFPALNAFVPSAAPAGPPLPASAAPSPAAAAALAQQPPPPSVPGARRPVSILPPPMPADTNPAAVDPYGAAAPPPEDLAREIPVDSDGNRPVRVPSVRPGVLAYPAMPIHRDEAGVEAKTESKTESGLEILRAASPRNEERGTSEEDDAVITRRASELADMMENAPGSAPPPPSPAPTREALPSVPDNQEPIPLERRTSIPPPPPMEQRNSGPPPLPQRISTNGPPSGRISANPPPPPPQRISTNGPPSGRISANPPPPPPQRISTNGPPSGRISANPPPPPPQRISTNGPPSGRISANPPPPPPQRISTNGPPSGRISANPPPPPPQRISANPLPPPPPSNRAHLPPLGTPPPLGQPSASAPPPSVRPALQRGAAPPPLPNKPAPAQDPSDLFFQPPADEVPAAPEAAPKSIPAAPAAPADARDITPLPRPKRSRGLHPMAYAFIAMSAVFGGVAAFVLLYPPSVPALPTSPSSVPKESANGNGDNAPIPVATVSPGGSDPKPNTAPSTETSAAPGSPPANPNSLSSHDVNTIIAQNQPLIRRKCWQPAVEAKIGGGPSARINATLLVGESGNVESVTAGGSERDYPGLSTCIANRLRLWKFPAAGGKTNVNIPFVFSAP